MTKFREKVKERAAQLSRAPVDAENLFLGERVQIKILTPDILDQFELRLSRKKPDERHYRAAFLVLALIDPESGQEALADADVDWVKDLPLAQTEPLFLEAQKANRADDPRKNSEAAASGSTTS